MQSKAIWSLLSLRLFIIIIVWNEDNLANKIKTNNNIVDESVILW